MNEEFNKSLHSLGFEEVWALKKLAQ